MRAALRGRPGSRTRSAPVDDRIFAQYPGQARTLSLPVKRIRRKMHSTAYLTHAGQPHWHAPPEQYVFSVAVQRGRVGLFVLK